MLWMFFCYGLLGWVLETAYAALRQRRYVDRSVLFGPLCLSYGLTGAVLTWGLWELRGRYFFLFLGCAVGATVVEWAAGHLLERTTHTRWWDYSARRFNLDGYICAGASAVWGLLGLAAVQWVSPLLVSLYRLLPPLAGHILLWVLVGLLLVDGLGTILTLAGVRETLPQMEAVNSRLAALSIRMGEWILRRTEGRIQRTYPKAQFVRREETALFHGVATTLTHDVSGATVLLVENEDEDTIAALEADGWSVWSGNISLPESSSVSYCASYILRSADSKRSLAYITLDDDTRSAQILDIILPALKEDGYSFRLAVGEVLDW